MTIEVKRNTLCGFCQSGHHTNCAVGIKGPVNTKHPQGVIWECKCDEDTCGTGRRKCTECGNRNTEEINPATWQCVDLDACRSTIETRRDSNPLLAEIREAKERANMAKIENDQAKAEKVAKAKEPTFCLVTGEPTKGGKFKPGMDARYVSERVIHVENANFTKKAADEQRAKMKSDGVSDALKAKFEKSLALSQERKAKKDQAAKDKADAKAEKEKEKAAAAAKA